MQGIDPCAQRGKLCIVEVAPQNVPACIRCAACQPQVAVTMAVYAVFGRLYALRRELLEHQRGAE